MGDELKKKEHSLADSLEMAASIEMRINNLFEENFILRSLLTEDIYVLPPLKENVSIIYKNLRKDLYESLSKSFDNLAKMIYEIQELQKIVSDKSIKKK